MKKIFTLALLAAASLSASAVTLWEGSCSFTNWNPIEGDERPVLSSSDFAKAVVGDKLVLTISEYGNDGWREAQIYGWNGYGTTELIQSSGSISGLTSYAFSLDEDLLAKLKETDVCIIGTGYTVTKIDLDTFDGTIWEGECICENWNATPAVNLPGSNFPTAKLGDVLVFYVEVLTPGDWAAIQINTANWQEGLFGQNIIADGQTEVRFTLDAELLESLQNDGIDITGANFKLTKIQLVSGDDDDDDNGDTEDDDNDNVIWSGKMTTAIWSDSLALGGSAFGTVGEGDALEFTVSNVADDGSLCIKQNLPDGWAEMPNNGGEYGNYLSLSNGDGVYSFDINQAAAESINTYGLVVAGVGFTLTKIQLIKGTTSGVNELDIDSLKEKPVYNLQGIKVADSIDAVSAHGLYIVAGKKIIK